VTARRIVTGAVVCLTLCASIEAGQTERFLLAGGSETLWLVRCNDSTKAFDVVARPVGGQWKWAARKGLRGRPVQAVAFDGRLGLLFAQPLAYLRLDLTSGGPTPGRNPDDPRWPRTTGPLATCDGGGMEDVDLLAVVAAAPAEPSEEKADSTQPSPSTVNLAVFSNGGSDWKYLTELENVRLAPDAKVFAATVGGELYVLICGAGGNRLSAWRRGQWREIPLHGAAAKRRVIAMLRRGGRRNKLAVFLADEDEPMGVSLVTFRADRLELPPQPITIGDQAATWDAGTWLLIVALGERFAFVWKASEREASRLEPPASGPVLRFATCGPDGRLDPPARIGVFATPPADERGKAISGYFTFAIMVAVFGVSILLRAKEPPRPFRLSQGVRPAKLAKRSLAGLIDLVPFLVIAQAFFPMQITPEQLESSAWGEIFKLTRDYYTSARGAYFVMLMLLGHLVYCVAMEMRFAATLGKMAFGLRVVANGGARAGAREVVLRNLVKIFVLGSLPLLMLIALLNRNRQRLGDLLARTAVVEKSPLVGPGPGDWAPGEDEDASPPAPPADEA